MERATRGYRNRRGCCRETKSNRGNGVQSAIREFVQINNSVSHCCCCCSRRVSPSSLPISLQGLLPCHSAGPDSEEDQQEETTQQTQWMSAKSRRSRRDNDFIKRQGQLIEIEGASLRDGASAVVTKQALMRWLALTFADRPTEQWKMCFGMTTRMKLLLLLLKGCIIRFSRAEQVFKCKSGTHETTVTFCCVVFVVE